MTTKPGLLPVFQVCLNISIMDQKSRYAHCPASCWAGGMNCFAAEATLHPCFADLLQELTDSPKHPWLNGLRLLSVQEVHRHLFQNMVNVFCKWTRCSAKQQNCFLSLPRANNLSYGIIHWRFVNLMNLLYESLIQTANHSMV